MPPNRVRRAYSGGALLDKFCGTGTGEDGQMPEDWVASTVPAANPGFPLIEGEGLARIAINSRETATLQSVFDASPDFYLGAAHVTRVGTQLGFLLKLLDSAVPLPVQAHPSRELARKYLHAPWGKFESYLILQTRPSIEPSLRIGFQHPPSKEEFRRIVLEQDLAAIDACFDPLPVAVGEVWVVPGGMPHAIGAGLLLIEAQEPSDLVVRAELTPNALQISPKKRYMGHDLDFALRIFNFEDISVEDAITRFKVTPKVLREENSYREEILIDEEYTDCFCLKRYTFWGETHLPNDGTVIVSIVIQGSGTILAGGKEFAVARGTRFLIPAAMEVTMYVPENGKDLVIISCVPGTATI